MFVTLEGPEGAGKSTVAQGLAQALTEDGHDVLVTREPGAGPIGAKIRSILLDSKDLSHAAELFLFLADRAEHVRETVLPALDQGQLVVCDRYTDSTLAYQGYARGMELELLRTLNKLATSGLVPDLTLLLDLDPETGISRIADKDRLDREPLSFHQAVRAGFLREAEREPRRWVVVDASRSRHEVLEDVVRVVRDRL